MKILFTVEDIFIIEPLGIMQMISFAKRLGHQCYFDIYSKNSFMDRLKEIKPDLVAISIMSISDESSRALIERIKDYSEDIFIIVGGPHPTYYPEFIHNCRADAICIGEGDGAFVDLLNSLESKNCISGIPNINTRDYVNAPRNLVEDLDQLPFVERDLVYRSTRLGETKLKSFMATRGCPFSCSYCFNSGYIQLYKGKGKILRRRSVGNLIEEIKMVKSGYPLEMIRFGDDVFIEKEDEWLDEFCQRYSQEIKLPFYCLISPKVVTPGIARQLKRAGCISAAISIETGDEKMRFEILKRRISDQEIVDAIKTLTDHRIRTYTNIMVGLPGATIKEEMKSLELAFKSRTTCAAFTIFTPFPGTKLHQLCLERKLIPETDKPVFPRSTTDKSALNCFSEKEKAVQKNIVLLGTLANGSRILRGIILKWLVYLPVNKVFFYVSFVVRNYYNYRYIWPIPLSAKEFFGYVKVVLKHDKKYL
jgi:radical SAM superfamily enzyme YgiQ (UPF0313 family)